MLLELGCALERKKGQWLCRSFKIPRERTYTIFTRPFGERDV